MKTQQADSLGRDAALRRPRIPRPRDAVPTVWLNLVCLDAPLVAIVWLWLFARTFQVLFQIGNGLALFLTAWLIYLADRFADSSTLKPDLPRSLRQDFCLQHRELWIVMIALVAGFDAYVIWRTTALQTFLAGAVVGLVAVIYLVLNHPLGLVWRSLPAKELAIGVLFALGTIVALLPGIPTTGSFGIAILTFAALCSLNCASIAAWERELDRAQRKVSLATRHPRVAQQGRNFCVILALTAFVLADVFRSAASVFICVAISALLLAWLDTSSDVKEGRFFNRPRRLENRRSLGIDQRTALADLVLLTPIAALIVTAL
ncbi:MAG: hypothetical protein QOJ87_1473 [Verrucomicrobiota bacterium]